MSLVVATWHTPEYAGVSAQHAEASARSLGIPLHVVPVPSRGSWVGNCSIKPSVAMGLLSSIGPDDWLLLVDADATFQKVPRVRGLIGLPDNNVSARTAGKSPVSARLLRFLDREDFELLSGTLLFAPCDEARAICRRWIELQEASPKRWDQRCLQDACEEFPYMLGDLPEAWAWIVDPKRKGTIQKTRREDAIIVHNQASRNQPK